MILFLDDIVWINWNNSYQTWQVCLPSRDFSDKLESWVAIKSWYWPIDRRLTESQTSVGVCPSAQRFKIPRGLVHGQRNHQYPEFLEGFAKIHHVCFRKFRLIENLKYYKLGPWHLHVREKDRQYFQGWVWSHSPTFCCCVLWLLPPPANKPSRASSAAVTSSSKASKACRRECSTVDKTEGLVVKILDLSSASDAGAVLFIRKLKLIHNVNQVAN